MKIYIFDFYRNNIPNFRGKIRVGKFLLTILAYFPNFLIPFKARKGLKYYLPSLKDQIGIELYFHGIYESEIVKFISNKINDGDTFFDVGANIGSIGLPIVKSKNVKYFGFEPSPSVYQFLFKNFEINNTSNIQLINKAVATESNSQLKFVDTSHTRFGEGHIAAKGDIHTISVETISLDDFCRDQNIATIDWLKVDVQGYEVLVFKGANKLLKSHSIKNIIFEFEDWAEKEAGFDVGMAKSVILGHGYKLWNLEGNNWSKSDEVKSTMIWATI